MQKRYEKVWSFVKICIILPPFLKLCKFSDAATKNERFRQAMRTKWCSHQLCRGEKTWSKAQRINTVTAPEQRELWRLLLCSYDKLDEYCSTWLVHEHFPTNITEKKIWLDGIDAADLQSIRDSETVGKNLPNFLTVFRYRCVHYPYFSAALADGHTLINNSINRAAMRTKRKGNNEQDLFYSRLAFRPFEHTETFT